MIYLINFSIVPPHQSQEAPARQNATLPHTAVFDTSGSCFTVPIIPLATSRIAPSDQPITLIPAPHTPASPPPLTRQLGRSMIDLIHNRAQVTVPFPEPLSTTSTGRISRSFSVATRPDQVESINNRISGICKDYPGIIPRGMHPEHHDPEPATCGCGSLE